MPLFLLRHGETVFNVAGRYQGQNDSELTKNGLRQARQNGQLLAELIEDTKHVHFVSSPLGRTLVTSEIICKALGIGFEDIRTDDRLMEMNYGAWQGMTAAEIDQEYPGQWQTRVDNPADFVIPGGGESYDALSARVDGWLDETRKHWDGDAVWIAVSHGGTGSVVRGRYLGLDVHEIRALDRPHDQFFELSNGQVILHGPELSG